MIIITYEIEIVNKLQIKISFLLYNWRRLYINGAFSNQIVKCVIYTSDKNIGQEKLLEIEKEKNILV